MSHTEQQSKRDPYNTFAEFDEALITHGYATLFAVAAPWVCAVTLFATVIETFVDVKCLTDDKQRPMPVKCKNNEPWSTAFAIYGVLGAFTNVALLIFSSNQYNGWSLTEKIVLFVFIEHQILLYYYLVKLIFPEIPKSVQLLQLKQNNIAHRLLENVKVEPDQDCTMFQDNRKIDFEIFDQDLADDEEGEDPSLDLRGSGQTLYEGVQDAVPSSLSRSRA